MNKMLQVEMLNNDEIIDNRNTKNLLNTPFDQRIDNLVGIFLKAKRNSLPVS